MLNSKLPFWMRGPELKKLETAFNKLWQRVANWLGIPLSKFDLEKCDLIIVDKTAYERKIVRLDGEDEIIYRKRVKFAFVNAKDAGIKEGLFRIFERLGIPLYDIKERQGGRDWDIVTFEVSDDILSQHKALVNLLVNTYGLTCRRYEYAVTDTIDQHVHIGTMSAKYITDIAKPSPLVMAPLDVSALCIIRNKLEFSIND
ncbi:phage tail protein [Vibrio vulnificus]|uniref:phage tail protein n=1 Tax=Vibrio vulnificus TaxID=672 RepID=UPI00102883D3|nr:phage tail protein [Vibrio vulnificus]RZP88965.1 phage tail protein [Vibrio vulnificus]